ncbi:vacuolar protein sorting-associated protein 55 [Salvia divinorum]|uniref:Vacuolar protein sorting-associated protein 55 n=1 Tax=Salvia divinorum TaxID=28513 RepID=A0ABD1FP29_SALDI
MADLPFHMRYCLQSGKLALLAILVSGGIVLQILACALYNNWWQMLTDLAGDRKSKPHKSMCIFSYTVTPNLVC